MEYFASGCGESFCLQPYVESMLMVRFETLYDDQNTPLIISKADLCVVEETIVENSRRARIESVNNLNQEQVGKF